MEPMYLNDVETHRGVGPRAEAIEQMRAAGIPVPQIMHLFAFKPDRTDHLAAFTQGVMRGPSPLLAGQRELIAAKKMVHDSLSIGEGDVGVVRDAGCGRGAVRRDHCCRPVPVLQCLDRCHRCARHVRAGIRDVGAAPRNDWLRDGQAVTGVPERFPRLLPHGRTGAGALRARSCAAMACATPFVHPNPSCVGYSPPPARLFRSATSYFSVILPVTR